MVDIKSTMIFSGNANKPLAKLVAKNFGTTLGKATVKTFSDGEISVEIEENVRGQDVYIIQPLCDPVNNNLMELLIMADALKRSSVERISVVLPYFGYSRQDRRARSARVPITAKVVANMLTSMGVERLLTIDLHADQIQGFFDIPVDNIYSLQLVIQYVNKHLFNTMSILENQQKYIVVSPDAGATKRTLKFAEHMQLNTIIMHKQRNYEKENVIDNTILIGDTTNLKNKTAIICDDMCDSGGTLIKVIDNLKKNGITNVIVIITHGIFSGQCIKRLQDCKVISKIIVSDTICQKENQINLNKLEIFSISELLGNAITNIINGNSLSILFE